MLRIDVHLSPYLFSIDVQKNPYYTIMSLHVTLATASDALDIANLASEELTNDRITKALLRLPETQSMRERRAWNIQILMASDPTSQFVKVCTSLKGDVLGYARWTIPLKMQRQRSVPGVESNESQTTVHVGTEETPEQKASAVATMVNSMKLWEEVMARLQEKRDKYTSTEATFSKSSQNRTFIQFRGADQSMQVLGLLDVYPQCRGQGAARKLLQWGLQRADEQGAEAYLETAPSLAPLFEKFGWVVVDEICFDFDEWDVSESGVQRWVCMLRKPQTLETTRQC